MYTHPLFAGNISSKHPSLYLHHTILVACMPRPFLQNTKTLFSRKWQSCGQGRQQTSKIHFVTDTFQLYCNCSGLNPCSRSPTLIQLWQTSSPGYSQLLLQIQALSTGLRNPLDLYPSLGLPSEPQTCPFSPFPVVSTLRPEALQIPPPLFSVFTPIVSIDPDAQAKNQESIILSLSLTLSSYNKSVPMPCQVLHFWPLNLSHQTRSVLDSPQRSEFTLTIDCWLILPCNCPCSRTLCTLHHCDLPRVDI